MLNTPLAPWPNFGRDETEAVSRVLLSNRVNYWTGEEGRLFEREFADYCGSPYAVALANGTFALDAALHALDVGAGDEVIVPPRTFLASVSSVVMAGAAPVFADVDKNSQNLTAQSIAAVLTPRTKAVIVVHLGGMAAEMDEIMALSEQHGFYVIEDCAQAHGARYKGRSVGNIGHIGAWSFCQDKILTTGGEGGMITTANENWWRKIWAYKDHGKSHDAVYRREHPPGFRWLHESFGTNGRMTEMQAAIGRVQLRKLEAWSQERRSNARLLADALAPFEAVRLQTVPEYIRHAQYKFYAFVRPEKLAAGWNRDRIIAELNALGTPCYQGSCSEVYWEKAFDGTPWRPPAPLPAARKLGETALMFLVHPGIGRDDMLRCCAHIRTVLARAQAV
ncbi:DegT/DnrJ/EryC1/StrS aminotransferase family protein [Neisseria leonii]|uniref:DegT/DnrJ/EryC1/StrS family aminotransferase n=1 Tax=Neisseria leonii TaxID=2995413 RepID=UPI00237C0DBD|nr:DegT/DnrJ/EryC1/StrS aminotransferase family protein [Neisseria sp. 3986]MDD9326439.1 DegT/DnrJ/EryC1/StrS aminotransferase family protein [Neisseria sp. 3986]